MSTSSTPPRDRISFHSSLAGGGTVEWPETLSIAHDAGFAAMDIVLPQIDGDSTAKVQRRLTSASVHVGGIPLPVEFRGDEQSFQHDIKLLPERARLAAEIGAKTMCRALPASSDTPRSALLPLLRRRIRACSTILADHDLRLGLEVVSPLHLRRKGHHELIWRLADGADFAVSCGPNVGILLDSWHWHHADGTVQDIVDLGQLICHVHLADAAGISPSAVRDDERLLPGTGVVAFDAFFSGLATVKYDGFLTPEIFGYRRNNGESVVACAQAAREAVTALLQIYFPE
jgi:sugar phosphate isomerase/epimerase